MSVHILGRNVDSGIASFLTLSLALAQTELPNVGVAVSAVDSLNCVEVHIIAVAATCDAGRAFQNLHHAVERYGEVEVVGRRDGSGFNAFEEDIAVYVVGLRTVDVDGIATHLDVLVHIVVLANLLVAGHHDAVSVANEELGSAETYDIANPCLGVLVVVFDVRGRNDDGIVTLDGVEVLDGVAYVRDGVVARYVVVVRLDCDGLFAHERIHFSTNHFLRSGIGRSLVGHALNGEAVVLGREERLVVLAVCGLEVGEGEVDILSILDSLVNGHLDGVCALDVGIGGNDEVFLVVSDSSSSAVCVLVIEHSTRKAELVVVGGEDFHVVNIGQRRAACGSELNRRVDVGDFVGILNGERALAAAGGRVNGVVVEVYEVAHLKEHLVVDGADAEHRGGSALLVGEVDGENLTTLGYGVLRILVVTVGCLSARREVAVGKLDSIVRQHLDRTVESESYETVCVALGPERTEDVSGVEVCSGNKSHGLCTAHVLNGDSAVLAGLNSSVVPEGYAAEDERELVALFEFALVHEVVDGILHLEEHAGRTSVELNGLFAIVAIDDRHARA